MGSQVHHIHIVFLMNRWDRCFCVDFLCDWWSTNIVGEDEDGKATPEVYKPCSIYLFWWLETALHGFQLQRATYILPLFILMITIQHACFSIHCYSFKTNPICIKMKVLIARKVSDSMPVSSSIHVWILYLQRFWIYLFNMT